LKYIQIRTMQNQMPPVLYQLTGLKELLLFARGFLKSLESNSIIARMQISWIGIESLNQERKYLYGPVPSRRLGLSLGVDIVPSKICTLDCVYCQVGKTSNTTIERKEYLPANLIVEELVKDKTKWVDFMMKFELGLEKPNINRARNSALTIGLAYVVGGLIPLLGYIFTSTPKEGLMSSTILTIICLFIFGYFKSKVTGQPLLKGALKVTLIGVIAAAAAFFVAQLFA